MKRLRKVTHAVLVWTTCSLLFVDPVAACRLLGHRCCCPCPPPACCEIESTKEATPSSPAADMPPGATTGAGELPEAAIAVEPPAAHSTRPLATESPAPQAGTAAGGVIAAPPSIPPNAPTRPQ